TDEGHPPGRPPEARISIGRLPPRELGSDSPASADLIFDHCRDPGILLKLLYDQAGEQIISTTSCKTHNEMDRPVRIVRLGPRMRGNQCRMQKHQRANHATTNPHLCNPLSARRSSPIALEKSVH